MVFNSPSLAIASQRVVRLAGTSHSQKLVRWQAHHDDPQERRAFASTLPQIIMLAEKDEKVNPIGIKGVGELGIVGTNAAIANAVHHATGRHIRRLPIRLEDLL